MDHLNHTDLHKEDHADLALKNARVVNVFSGEIHETNVAIRNGNILGFGEYDAKALIDLGGSYVCPGFIDAPVHIERSLLLPSRLARAIVPFGITTIVAEPEDLCRILGWDGLRFMMEASLGIPLTVYFTAPSCLKREKSFGEMENMNIERFLEPFRECGGRFARGIEPVSQPARFSEEILEPNFLEEIQALFREGKYIRLSGESSFNDALRSIVPLINPHNISRITFHSGSLFPGEKSEDNRIDSMVRNAIETGLNPISSIQMASINTARYYGLEKRGAIAPGYVADILVLNDLEHLIVDQVYKNGALVAEDSDLVAWEFPDKAPRLRDAMNVNWEIMDNIVIPAQGAKIRVIGVFPDSAVTREIIIKPLIEQNRVVCDPKEDVIKVVAMDRHFASGVMAKGMVKGFELKAGAIASSFSHSNHNVISVGANDEDIITAIEEIEKMRGGIAVVKNGVVLESLALPFAGILCDESPETVYGKMADITGAVRACGSKLPNPILTLSLLSCLKIPSLRITEEGLYDIHASRFVELFTK